MSIFTGSHIYNYFNRLCEAIESKIKSYDYRQLKDFSDADIDTIVNYFRIENISIDIDSALTQVKNGEGSVYNYDSQLFDDEPEYIDVKGKYITFLIPINGDSSLLIYSPWRTGTRNV